MQRLFAHWVIFIAVGMLFAPFAHAESLVWSKQLGDVPFLSARWKDAKEDKGWIRGTQVSVEYRASVTDNTGAVIACGSSVPKGTVLDFKVAPHVDEDVVWFGTGNFNDSPYGTWIVDAERPQNMCSTMVNVTGSQSDGDRTHVLYVVSPPSTTIDGLAGQSCTGDTKSQHCTMNTVGVVNAAFRFAETPSYMYAANFRKNGTACWSGPARPNTGKRCQPAGCEQNVQPPTIVPQQTIACSITVLDVESDTNAPSQPVLSSGGACVVGSAHTISFTSTDPDGDNIRYGIDWDANGTVDQWVPPSGYVPSGTSQNASRTYATSGTKTVRVAAQDENGALSSFASISFGCSGSVDDDAVAGFNEDASFGSDGSGSFVPQSPILTIRAIPSLVRSGDTTKVNWSASNVESCTVSGTNGDSWSGLASQIGGETSLPITTETTFALRCIDGNNNELTREAVVRILPSWRER